jgi:hypothetical protein
MQLTLKRKHQNLKFDMSSDVLTGCDAVQSGR